jgi:deoxyhypusine synthase
MTEDNYFCWSKKFNDKNSFQQKRYRIFNVEVSKEEYEDTKKIHHKLEFDQTESYETRFQTAFKKMWSKLSEKEKQEYFDIPHFNWEGFTFITGVEKDL